MKTGNRVRGPATPGGGRRLRGGASGAAWAAAVAIAFARLAFAAPAVGAPGGPTKRPATRPAGGCEKYLYIPPSLAGNVILYHSFSRGAGRAEIDRLGGRVAAAKGKLVAGLTGSGYRPVGKAALGLHKLAWPLHKPITVGLWWRLEEPMKADSAFHLVSLRSTGYISNFVRGKGRWCALTEPTFVVQVYNFPGISNVNGIRFGSAWMKHGVWHHAAVTVSEGSKVCVYWDGRLRSRTVVKGRLFGPADVIRSIDLGPHWLAHPMTIDEVLVLDRALTAGEVGAYVTAVTKLAEAGFPFEARTARHLGGREGNGQGHIASGPERPKR